MKKLIVIWETLRLQMKNSFARPMFRFCLIANPIVNTVLIYEMFKNSGQENFATYVILGSGLMGLWSCICFSSAGDINRERYSGTLANIFAAPAGFRTILFGKILGNTVMSLLTFVLSFLTAKLLYRAPFEVESPGYLIVSLVATLVGFAVFSTLVAYLLTLSRKTTLYMNCIEIPIILVCGFVFPVEELPAWVLPISYVLPPTWAVKLLRLSVAGISDSGEYIRCLGILGVVAGSYAAISVMLYRMVDKFVRIKATLEVF